MAYKPTNPYSMIFFQIKLSILVELRISCPALLLFIFRFSSLKFNVKVVERKKWLEKSRSKMIWTWDLSESVIHDFNYGVTDRNPNDRLMRCLSPGYRPQLLITRAEIGWTVPTSRHRIMLLSLCLTLHVLSRYRSPPRHMSLSAALILKRGTIPARAVAFWLSQRKVQKQQQ